MAGGSQEEAISKAGPKEAAERREAHGLAGLDHQGLMPFEEVNEED